MFLKNLALTGGGGTHETQLIPSKNAQGPFRCLSFLMKQSNKNNTFLVTLMS